MPTLADMPIGWYVRVCLKALIGLMIAGALLAIVGLILFLVFGAAVIGLAG